MTLPFVQDSAWWQIGANKSASSKPADYFDKKSHFILQNKGVAG